MSADPRPRTPVLMNRCPHCGVATDRVTAAGCAATPGFGDLSLCVACGEWSIFGFGLVLRMPTDDEFAEIGADPMCRRARAAWVEAFTPPTPPSSPGPGA